MSRGLTDIAIRKLKAKEDRYEVPDGHGLYVLVQPSGARGFCVRYRFGGISKKLTLKTGITLAAARKETAAAMYEVEQGHDPSIAKKDAKKRAREKVTRAGNNTVQAICEEYLSRESRNLRSADQRKALLRRAVYPALSARQIDTVKRSELVRLFDKIEDERGPVAADMALAVLRRVFSWHAARDDDFRSPIIRGMMRTKPRERARSRILNDSELRRIWATANEMPGPFPALVRFLLLTAARRGEAADMTWSELDGVNWILRSARNKVKQDLVRPLSKAAQDLLAGLPRFQDCDFVFTSDGQRAIAGFSKFKTHLDKQCGVTGWTLHDLRRTARSLMSRAGVNSDHAERCLGHVITGVRGVYDRYEFHAEKKAALEALVAQIERIVNLQENVIQLRR
jgi:integrase